MNQSKHTLGPWKLRAAQESREPGVIEIGLEAAAPDLLAALEIIAALCDRTAALLRSPQGRGVTAEGQAKLFDALTERAQSAIAKATKATGKEASQ